MKLDINERAFRISVALMAAIAVIFALKAASRVIVPILLSVFIYLAFYPYMNKLAKAGVSHWVVVTICMAVLVFILFLFLFLAAYTVDQTISTVSEYASLAEDLHERALSYVSRRFKIQVAPSQGGALSGLANLSVGLIGGNIGQIRKVFVSVGLIMIYDLFLFIDHEKIKKAVGKRMSKRRTLFAIELSIRQLSGYVGVKLIVSFITAASFLAIMLACGMRGAIVLAGVVFVANFIPTIGSVVVTLLVSILAFLQFGSSGNLMNAIVITFVGIVTQFVVGNIIDPKYTGKSVRMSPFLVLMSLALWGFALGPVGMILAVPMTCAIRNFAVYGGLMA